ncbi:MAG: hypothetical protein U0X75_03595 [Acidobacteriota bacterium]
MNKSLIITTNYDCVLRWACPLSGDLQEWILKRLLNKCSFASKAMTADNLAFSRPNWKQNQVDIDARRLSTPLFRQRDGAQAQICFTDIALQLGQAIRFFLSDSA